MNIALAFRQDMRKTPVECYPRSFLRILQRKGHNVITCGEGHEIEFLGDLEEDNFDILIEIENGRNKKGELLFQQSQVNWKIPSALWAIDPLCVKTKVLTENGWKTMLSIQPGDKVFSADGKFVEVKSISPVYFNRDSYEIVLDTGEKIKCDENHKWNVFVNDKNYYKWKSYNLSTKKLYDIKNDFSLRLMHPKCLEFDEQKDLLIPPYILGLWIGNGNKYDDRITQNILDKEDILLNIKNTGWSISCVRNESRNKKAFRVSGLRVKNAPPRDYGKGKEDIWCASNRLKRLGLYKNKYIPNQYIYSSKVQRIELLKGLLDSDGECAKDGTAYYHSSEKKIAKQVYFLINSLGIKAVIKQYKKKDNFSNKVIDMYRVGFVPPNYSIFSVKRKLNRQLFNKKYSIVSKSRKIISIKKIESVPVRCISVDSDSHLFLITDSLIPTHNSHGNPGIHKYVSFSYSHVFFAPWIKRDIYSEHSSAHWCPNSTDLKWFDRAESRPQYDFVFVSSRMGLSRADNLKRICLKRGWSPWIGEVSKAGKHKWPYCAQKMREGAIGYNWSQRQDAPNQRVMETMAVGIPLLQDICPLSGMDLLFENGKHYIGYNRDWSDLEDKMEWAIRNPNKCKEIAEIAYQEVKKNHLIENRVNQILEVMNGN